MLSMKRKSRTHKFRIYETGLKMYLLLHNVKWKISILRMFSELLLCSSMKCYVFLPCFHEPPINECLSDHFIVFLYVYVSYLQLAVQYKNNLMYNVNGVQMTNFLQTLAFIFSICY